jgi:hypothetical protein
MVALAVTIKVRRPMVAAVTAEASALSPITAVTVFTNRTALNFANVSFGLRVLGGSVVGRTFNARGLFWRFVDLVCCSGPRCVLALRSGCPAVVSFVARRGAPMPYFKGTYFYNMYQQGWSETWFLQSTDLSSAYNVFIDTELVTALANIRSQHTVLLGVRVVQVDGPPVPRVSRRGVFQRKGSRGKPGNPAFPPNADLAATAVMMNASYSDGHTIPLFLRGLADEDTIREEATGVEAISDELRALINSLGRSIAANPPFAGRKQDPDAGSGPVAGFSENPDISGNTTVATTVVPLAAVKNVFFTGYPHATMPWLKGDWRVSKLTALSFDINYPWNLKDTVAPLNCAWHERKYSYPTFTKWTVNDLRTRQTGRPTNLTRGRASGIHFRRSARAVG